MFRLNKNYINYFLFFLIVVSYFFGFFFNENSAGAGGYKGDITWILKNIEIFKTNNLIDAIFDEKLFGNRTPLIYIINKIFNPFFFEYEKYRYSISLFSFLGIFIFYLGLKNKFKEVNQSNLLLISSVILLSPYYRTSAYWALNENYGIFFSILSLVLLNSSKNWLGQPFYFLKITLLISSSSLCVYFDQKLIIIPLITYLTIINYKKKLSFKITITVLYGIFSIPYLFLIYKWGGLVPPLTQLENPNSVTSLNHIKDIYLFNVGYASTIIGFYIFPFIFFKEKNLLNLLKQFFLNRNNYIIIFIGLIYILVLNFFYNFEDYTIKNYWIGLGYIHKFSKLIFSNLIFQEIFTYLAFFISWIIIWLFTEKNLTNILIISFYFCLSLLFWPMMQEYFDPIILILITLAFRTKIKINFYNSIFLVIYFSLFLIAANFYYYKIL